MILLYEETSVASSIPRQPIAATLSAIFICQKARSPVTLLFAVTKRPSSPRTGRICVSEALPGGSGLGGLLAAGEGGILATPVRDTMKRGGCYVAETVSREHLWHALTPQFFPTAMLKAALHDAIQAGVLVTDEASAMEWAGHRVLLVEGHSDNIKITQPADLALAAFYLEQ